MRQSWTALLGSLVARQPAVSLWAGRDAIREELFSAERIEDHARSLAAAQSVTTHLLAGRPLAGRLTANGVALQSAYRIFVKAIDEARTITPAAEWLVDNYYIVERQIGQIRSDLPPGYYRQLPKLATGPMAGYPRVFGIAWAYVAHTDSRFSAEMLTRFARAYQEIEPLTIGELWALSITLRIVLIENLRRLADEMVEARQQRQAADALADRLLGPGTVPSGQIPAILNAPDRLPLADAFTVQLVHRLRDQDPSATPAVGWLDRRLAENGSSADDIVRDVHRRQGATNVSVRNVITSLRLIGDVDWNDLVEHVSLVDGVLAQCAGFAQMDFPTRNLYRSAVEELARGCDLPEREIASRAVASAERRGIADTPDTDPRHNDPGYYLLAGGRATFETEIGFQLPLRQWPLWLVRRFGVGGYGALVATVTLAALGLPCVALVSAGLGDGWIAMLMVLGIIPAMDVSIALINRLVTSGFGTTTLPALEFKDGIPSAHRTLVAVPTLLSSSATIAEQVERLEIHHLASPDGDLHFALLSDWLDADVETLAEDTALLNAAMAGIERLNIRYGPAPGGARFLLLHRRRQWSDSESRWIGWERKRGKLHELNQLLRGARTTSFVITDDPATFVPPDIRYVVTLDGDTRLPRDTVHRLIGKLAHPLNRPRFDANMGRVVEGYAVLQPRVTPSLPVGQQGSRFQRVFSSLAGIDPYAAAVSDVYQDLFGEGSYAGKGIYDVDAFEAAMAGRVPEATMLSHDLFEGIFARAGLASDIEVVEEFPSRYDVASLRLHRWARGDWQLLPWILRLSPSGMPKDSIPAVGRWKMLDNLRRTLTAPLAVIAFIIGWLLPLAPSLIWTAFILASIVLPTLIPVFGAIPFRYASVTLSSHLRALVRDLGLAAGLSGLGVVFLADQAVLMSDAILRTLYRLLISRKNLLEWVPAAAAARTRRLDLVGVYGRMLGAMVVAGIGLAVPLGLGTGGWIVALPFVLAWVLSPAVARWVSISPKVAGNLAISAQDAEFLRLTARRTWRYFETFVTSAEHMLPPDNFQEDPSPVVAQRTSPTNMGLLLLATVSARDFGWIGTSDALSRLEATMATMDQLDRFRGHFYNWYDLVDLAPLEPRYVSSVDSGNLAGHLIALASTLEDWRTQPLEAWKCLAGIADALTIARIEAALLSDGRRTQTVTWGQLDSSLAELGLAARQTVEDVDLTTHLQSLATHADIMRDMAKTLALERNDASSTELLAWVAASCATIASHVNGLGRDAVWRDDLNTRLTTLAARARAMALAMDFGFLLNQERKLLSIGYVVTDDALDPSCYDLLASEARLASFVAIAKGDIPARHWFRLGRTVTPVAHGAALVSWSGSMFEYLMPSLIMRAPEGSLLEQTNGLAVHRQIAYAASIGLPWGISESAYNARDLELTYQYSSFGVPGLGLKRGLGENRVIAPYATALATMVAPGAAVANLIRLEALGGRGRYGFYEALDYTADRLPKETPYVVVKAYMAHHQGMSIIAIADALFDGLMRSRFHAEPMVQATELLLQERMPRDVSVTRTWTTEVASGAVLRDLAPVGGRRIVSPHLSTPVVHLLANNLMATMLTSAGSGYTRWGNLAITRWREDATADDYGSYIFLRDLAGGPVWSAGFQPTGIEPDEFTVNLQEDRAEFIRRDGSVTTTMEVIVSAEDNAEVRRISIQNGGVRARDIEVTSYAELALATQAADMAHPAFSKLFVETEYRSDLGALIATRRKRDPGEPEVWVGHLAVIGTDATAIREIETDRARFIGRGRGIHDPLAMIAGHALSGTSGTVLDPIFSIRRTVRVEPGAVARVSFWTVVADSREALMNLIDKHRESAAFGRAATLAWTQAQVQLRHLGISTSEAALFQRLAANLVFAGPGLRPSSDSIARGVGPQSSLWGQSISGDLPILLLRIADIDYLDIARQLMKAHEYWRMKHFAVDLVIVNDRQSSYVQDLQIALETLARTSQSSVQARNPEPVGRLFVLRGDLMLPETRALLSSVARVVLVAQRGTLAEQLDRHSEPKATTAPIPQPRKTASGAELPRPSGLEFFNGLGGFDKGGTEYLTILGPGQSTPAPWINVIANASFGFQVSTDGSGYTWSVNSRQNQLTPWSNDPVSDTPGEAFFLRDEETGTLWSPTALPIRSASGTYTARHGRGFSQFDCQLDGIASCLTQFVPVDAPVKISRLKLTNRTGRARVLSVTAYVEWVLGTSRSQAAPFIITTLDAETRSIFARNPWTPGFADRIAFADLGGRQTDWTGDRREFLGRHGTLASPAALNVFKPLSGTLGAGLDPCATQRTAIDIPPGETIELVFLLGDAADAVEARRLILHYRAADLDTVKADIARQWDEILGTVQVRTPDRAMDILLNGWLTYQSLACRVWARSGFYQSSGAYGFRDQLQDGLSLVSSRPDIVRAHLLAAAGRQFEEGDVQHWWMPQSGQGVRTRISDDRPWLAFAAAHYVAVTGDKAVLDVQIPFLEGQTLREGEHDSLFSPTTTDRTASLYDHCALALDASLALGGHGLPLMGTGDWNDGMNRVGELGSGESVWLGWLMIAALEDIAHIALTRGDATRAEIWRAHADALKAAINAGSWDGQWYLRGRFDDGTPLGASGNQECRIDSIAQSWSVLSGGGTPELAAMAMESVERDLIRTEDGLALLFAPPFNRSLPDPGYIKGYPPGIRENGGQYTHGAIWSVMAFAKLGEGDKAHALFSMLNPINHARTRAEVHRYKVEPYVIAADIYAHQPHVGRGGWTWYTGSAGWMQRAGVESILGIRILAGVLHFAPCIPSNWPGFEFVLRWGTARYEIQVTNPNRRESGLRSAMFDGKPISVHPLELMLSDDGNAHLLEIVMGDPIDRATTQSAS